MRTRFHRTFGRRIWPTGSSREAGGFTFVEALLVVAVLAVAKAGAASLPLDPDAPLARLATVLAESRALALLVPDHAWERLAHLHARTLVPGWQLALDADDGSAPPARPCACNGAPRGQSGSPAARTKAKRKRVSPRMR